MYVWPGNNGGIHVTGPTAALIAALIFGVINAILRPILIVLTLPAVILTLGLFTLIINGFVFWLVAKVNIGFSVDNFWPSAVLGALVLSIISFILSHLVKPMEEKPATTP